MLPLIGPPSGPAQALALLVGALTLAPTSTHAQFPADVRSALDDAVDLYRGVRGEQFRIATDPNERYEVLVGPRVFEIGGPDYVFAVGDEAFEAEYGRAGGLGQGEAWGPQPLPARNRRVHDGERGGLDASSCRGCHFVGGPDGSGALTQVGLLRGDGRHLSSVSVREAPHIMGVGYLTLAARDLEALLQRQVTIARLNAEGGEPFSVSLEVDGIDFGRITANPDGTLDTAEVRGVSPDLIIRPFGHKGRHPDLVALSEEALHVHHGMQTASYIETRLDDLETWLGPHGRFDPDGDGVQLEATEAQAVLLASYMSMLGVPTFAPPADPELALIWSRGRATFDAVGCADCHRPRLFLQDLEARFTGRGERPFEVSFDLSEAGQEPQPRRLDFSPDEDDRVRGGVPIFPFTDLRRHDMGPALAEPVDEALPDGADVIPGSVWLTRPLWGLADTAPYLHDGRAPTVHDAILAHGGDAADSRAAYVALDAEAQGALRVFLMSLTRPATLLVE